MLDLDVARIAIMLAEYEAALAVLVVAVAVIVFLSGLDDIAVDTYYWVRRAYRALIVRQRHPRLPIARLHAKPESPIAIMIPAWREAEVIGPMLTTNTGLIDYANYHIFVGVYRNDPDTIREVDRVAATHRRVHRIVAPHPGPTNKADCLNAILRAILDYEREKAFRFAGVALHDAEDIVHPLELKFFNYLVGRKDLIQLPIFSLRRGPLEWVAGTYMDEFAEWHSKDLVVRESLTGIVPCAGVAACFSRTAIDALMADRKGEPFNVSSLTEDYDVAFRMKKLGLKEVFVRFPVDFTVDVPRQGGELSYLDRREPIAAREFFPSEFKAAYRQRARWLLGIAFQGWHDIGWHGSLGARYFFLRDRKAVITAPASMLALFLMVNFLIIEGLQKLIPDINAATGVFGEGGLLVHLLWINVAFLAVRLIHRIYFTTRLYGALHGAMAVPRLIVSTLVNFFAAARAIAIAVDARLTGRPIVWDKTKHTFPLSTATPAAGLSASELPPRPVTNPEPSA